MNFEYKGWDVTVENMGGNWMAWAEKSGEDKVTAWGRSQYSAEANIKEAIDTGKSWQSLFNRGRQ